MGKKSKNKRGGLVFSTDPNYSLPESDGQENINAKGEKTSPLRVIPEKKGRGGKTVTIVRGFEGNAFNLSELGKNLKQTCGVGGTVKNGEIILQGDHVNKVVSKLLKMGFPNTKRAGG